VLVYLFISDPGSISRAYAIMHFTKYKTNHRSGKFLLLCSTKQAGEWATLLRVILRKNKNLVGYSLATIAAFSCLRSFENNGRLTRAKSMTDDEVNVQRWQCTPLSKYLDIIANKPPNFMMESSAAWQTFLEMYCNIW